MMGRYTGAGLIVVGLIGERGRESRIAARQPAAAPAPPSAGDHEVFLK
jgi:hypothetical protein